MKILKKIQKQAIFNSFLYNLNYFFAFIATGLEEAARNAGRSNRTTWQPLLAMLMLLWMRLSLRTGGA